MPERKLNLAMLNRKREEMEKSEQIAAKAGSDPCKGCYYDCSPEYGLWSSLVEGIMDAINCPCGSMWVDFGLRWG